MGLLLAVVFVAAGALLHWGGTFATGQVTDQLTSQKITFPEAGSGALKGLPEENQAAMNKYAGMEMTTGEQAYTYANNYIHVHMQGVAAGKTYEEVSGEFLAAAAQLKTDPTNTDLAGQVATLGQQRQTLFMGSTLVGLLGFTYAFATLGNIALISSTVAYGAGIVFLLLALAGFAHMRKANAAA